MDPRNVASMKAWIDSASYEELLARWRHTPTGSVWFQGAVGDHFHKVMQERRAALSPQEVTAASKAVGWDATKAMVGSPGPMEGSSQDNEDDR